MSTYEDDHNISTSQTRRSRPRELPELESRSRIASASTPETTLNTSSEIQAAHRMLAQAYELLGQNDLDLAFEIYDDFKQNHSEPISDQFLESLDRVSAQEASKEIADCPICTTAFAEQKHPLIVRLPCEAQHKFGLKFRGHLFDYECVAPWLKEHLTCPMCRFDVSTASEKRRKRLEAELARAREEEEEEEEEEEGWEVYG